MRSIVSRDFKPPTEPARCRFESRQALCWFQRLRLAALATALLASATQTACGPSKIEWREEVQLASGEVVHVRRTAKLKENRIAGGGGGSFNEGMTVEITQPLKRDNPGVWSARFVPVIFDRDPVTKEWTMVATFFHCSSWNELGRPKLPYTEYRYRDNQWIQQPLSPQWIGKPANMFTGMTPDWSKDLTVVEKAGRLNDPMVDPSFRSVSSKWQHGC